MTITYCLLAAQLVLAPALATTLPPGFNANILPRDFDVKIYAALGDSFASGPSAGDMYDKSNCRRHINAWPPELSRSQEFKGSNKLTFDFFACAGAVTDHIYLKGQDKGATEEDMKPQAVQLKGVKPQLVTLSIGGNDVKFTEVLQRCVYKYEGVFNGCQQCHYSDGSFDDCTKDCTAAMDELEARVTSSTLGQHLRGSYKAILDAAPNTQLFVTGYPKFWNADTDACDGISFKAFCGGAQTDEILPLIKARRKRMNDLTSMLNSRIKSIVSDYNAPSGSKITFVETDSFFEGHRFCEEGVEEPSYRNDKIWFYPFEWRTAGTFILEADSQESKGEECDGVDASDDQGLYFSCQAKEPSSNSASVDMSQFPNNAAGDHEDDLGILDASTQSEYLDQVMARIFHPTKKGHQAYMQAILRAYHADTPVGDSAFLRVLPIGDSITWGSHSSDRNGYRNTLHNLLTKRGNSVDFVGSVPSGTMEDNQHEGHRGETISQISASSSEGIHAGVNLVLLHAGTNDANLGIDIEHAAQRLKKLMEKIWKYNPTAVILVCQIIPSSTHEIQERIELFNSLIPGVVQTFIAAKKRVVMVKMNEAVDVADLDDNLHPKDEGYVKMANTWFDAINEADSKGWITAPGDPTEGGDEGEVCETTPTWSLPHLLAEGAKVAKSDGDFIPKWNTRITAGEASCKRANLRFFDLDGDGVKDFACLDSDSSEVSVHLNRLTDGHVPDKGDLEFEVAKGGIGRPASGVLFADLNGDGRDDFIYVNPDGEVDAWINLGKDSSDSGWAWKSIGQIAGGVGATEKNLQMADINGDGRADFLLVDPDSGEVTGWLNKGAEIMPDYHKLGIIASGRTTVKDDVVFMGDFTGEGRADYMVVSKDGKVSGYTNRLQEDTALIPRWLERLTLIDVSGLASVPQAGVRMVDLNGDGKVDFVWINSDGDINVWENAGEGGKYQPGEGVFICDLDGDGIGDYFWVDENGHGWGYLNVGHGDNLWHDLGNTAIGTHIREDLRMAVLTKTGRADYVLIDEFSGRADWWQNLGVGQDWGWESRGVAATGPRKTFEAEYGGKFTGKNVRFADLDGDGFDDYLYLSPRGSVVMWRNLQTNPISWGLPKLVANKAEAVVPSNIRFADINGDGLLDYIVVDPVSGGGRMWANLGVQGDGSIRWNTPEVIASGASTGPGYAIQIADMTGDGRADYMSINPDNGRVDLWINTCSG